MTARSTLTGSAIVSMYLNGVSGRVLWTAPRFTFDGLAFSFAYSFPNSNKKSYFFTLILSVFTNYRSLRSRKIGCTSEIKINEFILYFAQFSLSLQIK